MYANPEASPDADTGTTTYTVTYTLQTPFAGSAGTVTIAAAGTVSIQPSPPPAGATGTVVLDAVQPGIDVTGTVQMVINIVNPASARTPNTFYPVGLAIQTSGGSTKLPTAGIFSTQASATRATTITLTDVVATGSPAAYFDFVVLFQDSSGYFGSLDPLISNDA